MIDCEIYPIFSSPVAVFNIKEDLSALQSIKRYEFHNTEVACSNKVQITKRTDVLDDFPYEKNILFEYFNLYKNEFLHLESTSFIISTSWATKANKNSYSQFHNHLNSVYSCVFYLDEDSQSAKIEFDSSNIFPHGLLLNEPSEKNIYNSKSWSITPGKNMIIIFPSYLTHRIGEHKSDKTRYSIAFNLFPNCLIGNGDSSVNLE